MPRPFIRAGDNHRKWWEGKIKDLEDLGGQVAHIDPNVVYGKPRPWPAIKLTWTGWLIDAYFYTMRGKKASRAFDSLHAIDFTAGSGLTEIGSKLKGCKSKIVAGTALLAADDDRADKHWFAEPRKRSLAPTLKKRLNHKLGGQPYYLGTGKRREEIKKIAAGIEQYSDNPHYIAIVDQEGFRQVALDDLVPLLDVGSKRGDIILNVHTRDHYRSPKAFAKFIGAKSWNPKRSNAEALQAVKDKLDDLGRPRTVPWRVQVGGGNDWYYDMVVCVADLPSGAPWLDRFEEELARRMPGIDGAMLNNILCTRDLMAFDAGPTDTGGN